MSLKKLLSVSVISVAMVGCGDDDEGGGGGVGDPDALASSISSPSGEVTSAATAQGVADEFGAILSESAGIGGERRNSIDCSGAQSQDFSCTCSEGGTLDVSVSGNQDRYEATYEYNSCCISTCCFEGGGWIAGTATGESDFNQCASFEGDVTCDETGTASFSYAYCLENGVFWYLVEYESETYAVSGTYNSETNSGTWKIRDKNGEWNCTETNGSGSCTNGTDTYEW